MMWRFRVRIQYGQYTDEQLAKVWKIMAQEIGWAPALVHGLIGEWEAEGLETYNKAIQKAKSTLRRCKYKGRMGVYMCGKPYTRITPVPLGKLPQDKDSKETL